MKIVIDKDILDTLIEDNPKTYSEIAVKMVLESLIRQSQPLSDVVKPLLEDAWNEGRENPFDFNKISKQEYISSLLEKLNK